MSSEMREQICRKLESEDLNFDKDEILNAPAISLSNLLKHQFSFRVSFSRLPQRRQIFVKTLENGFKNLQKKSYFVTGKLTVSSKSEINGSLPGNVVLRDRTFSISCLIKGDYRIYETLNRDVFLMDWNFITNGLDAYIEVNDLVDLSTFSEGISHKSLSCDAISVKDAVLTLKYRERLAPGRLNIYGNVSNLSALIRMKTDYMFLVKLADEDKNEVNILVKRSDQLHWQKFITPGEHYLFTNLRPTTVQKGTITPTMVYVVWEGAEFIPKSQWTGHIVTLKDWLGLNEMPATVKGDNLAQDSGDVTRQNLYTYQGTITNACRPEVGIYELDNKIGLYLCYLPSVHRLRSLRPGCTVTVYNVHYSGSPQPPKIRLVACVQSCIKVTGFSPFDVSSVKSMESISRSSSLYMLQQQSVNLAQLEKVLAVEDVLTQKLGSVVNGSIVLSCLQSSPNIPGSSTVTSAGTSSPLQEFLSTDHDCGPFKQNDKNDFPLVVRIGELSERLSSLDRAIQHLREKFSDQQLHTEQLSEKLYWSYQQQMIDQTNKEILVGVLKASSVTGQVQLVDNTGTIDVVIAPQPENNTSHNCEKLNCCTRESNTHTRKCPFVKTSDLGSIVLLDRYCVLTEQFLMSSFPSSKHIGDPQYVHKARIKPYLMFSMQDIHILNYPSRNFTEKAKTVQNGNSKYDKGKCDSGQCSIRVPEHNVCTGTHNCNKSNQCFKDSAGSEFVQKENNYSREHQPQEYNQKSCQNSKTVHPHNNNSHCDKCSCQVTQLKRKSCEGIPRCDSSEHLHVYKMFYLLHKESLMIDSQVQGKPNLRFTAVGFFLNFDSNQRIGCRCEKCLKKSAPSCSSDLDCDKGGGGVNRHRCTHLSTRSNAVGGSICGICENELKKNKVLLIYQGEIVSNYHLLTPGQFYQLCVPKCDDIQLRPRYISSAVKTAVAKFQATQCIVLPSSVKISCMEVKNIEDSQSCEIFDQENETWTKLPPSVLDVLRSDSADNACTIGDILSESCKWTLVSVYGVIKTRTHLDPEPSNSNRQVRVIPGERGEEIYTQLGVSVLGNRCIQLEITDQGSSLTVYMNLNKSSFPLGLLPGVRVKFSRLERRMSKKGTIYCQYIAISTVQVVACGISSSEVTPDFQKMKSAESLSALGEPRDDKNFSTFELGYLGDQWVSPPSTFYSICHVLQLLRVSFKALCSKCGTKIIQRSCPSSACLSQGRRLVAKASLLVDDGSSTAIVLCQGDTVRDILGLSPSQLDVVENRVTEFGELFIQQTGQTTGDTSNHPLAAFFTKLCDSSLVKRLWKMYLTTNKFASTKTVPTDTMSLEEFCLKTVNTGSVQLETRCLPFLQLACVKVEPVDVSAVVLHHLNNLDPAL